MWSRCGYALPTERDKDEKGMTMLSSARVDEIGFNCDKCQTVEFYA